MNQHQCTAIQALEMLRGDDTLRAERQFRGMTKTEMQQMHGESGSTRAQILQGYRDYDKKINAAIEWVRGAK